MEVNRYFKGYFLTFIYCSLFYFPYCLVRSKLVYFCSLIFVEIVRAAPFYFIFEVKQFYIDDSGHLYLFSPFSSLRALGTLKHWKSLVWLSFVAWCHRKHSCTCYKNAWCSSTESPLQLMQRKVFVVRPPISHLNSSTITPEALVITLETRSSNLSVERGLSRCSCRSVYVWVVEGWRVFMYGQILQLYLD
jgi:hypothetical protein